MKKIMSAIDKFNADAPVGSVVEYWLGARAGEPSGRGTVRHPATLLGGHTPVAWIDGCKGCVALSHVRIVSRAAGGAQ